MGKLLKAAVYVFALIGALVTAASGYIYANHSELVAEFWNVRNEVRLVPEERRTEVIAELPERITFERTVREDMGALPEDRQKALYEQLAASREQVFEQFAQRIKQEAEIARKSKTAVEASKKIVDTLGKVSVGVSLQGGAKASTTPAPRPDPLAKVEDACEGVADARDGMREARQTSDSKLRVDSAVAVLAKLDVLGDEVIKARAASLNGDEKKRLQNVVRDAKETLYSVKQTPGLDDDPRAKPLLTKVPTKLSS